MEGWEGRKDVGREGRGRGDVQSGAGAGDAGWVEGWAGGMGGGVGTGEVQEGWGERDGRGGHGTGASAQVRRLRRHLLAAAARRRPPSHGPSSVVAVVDSARRQRHLRFGGGITQNSQPGSNSKSLNLKFSDFLFERIFNLKFYGICCDLRSQLSLTIIHWNFDRPTDRPRTRVTLPREVLKAFWKLSKDFPMVLDAF